MCYKPVPYTATEKVKEWKLCLENFYLYQALATYDTHAKRGTRNDFHWHAEWIEIQ
jgi:hypothetical protein